MRQSDRKRKLIDYFKRNIKKGYTPDSLKYALMNQGYIRIEIDSCLEEAQKEMAETAPVLKEKPKIVYEVLDHEDNPIYLKKSWWEKLWE